MAFDMIINGYPYNYIVAGVAAVGVVLVLTKKYFNGGVCRSKALIHNKTVIITGGNTGIGKEAAIDLARRGGKIILACRDPERGRNAEEDIRRKSGSDEVFYRQLDLASLDSVRQFAELMIQEESRIDILINNAGIMACPHWKTEDGFEMQFGVNHLGHFLLTNLLLDKLKESPSARIVNVSSSRYKFVDGINFDDINSEGDYDPIVAYGRSKLANILFTRTLAQKLKADNVTNVTVNCLHPGMVWTELSRHLEKKIGFLKKLLFLPFALVFFRTPHQGCQTVVYCAISDELRGVSGKYFGDCKMEKLKTAAAQSDEDGERLWSLSAELVGLDEN
jgi:retinol dehydrogenase-13